MREGIQLDGVRVAAARQALPGFNGRSYLRQSEFADVVGIHPVTLNRIENNKTKVSLETLEGLCEHLGRTREWLMGVPEEVDELEAAREQMATALSKIAEGYEDFGAAVEALNARIREVSGEQVPA
jgi:transcriptional regulator with XRE-family HTH domain